MKYALITDHIVEKLYGQAMCNQLSLRGFDVQLFSFPAGESSKTRETKEKLEDALLSEGFGRDTTIIALGGGVVTDLVGFLAATFCRGVELILIPTTLLGMVDAAIGGKNGVNTSHGKNLIGSFCNPQKLYICPEFLKTLPEQEWFNGAIEMLKAGLIADADYFHRFSEIPISKSIDRAIEIKRRIISRDLTEKGLRRVLNVGHTIAHALESLSDYRIPHGTAVAIGVVLEAEISHQMGILKKEALEQIRAKFPPVTLDFGFDEIYDVMRRDKKSEDGTPRLALLEDIGVPYSAGGAYCVEVSRRVIKEVVVKYTPMDSKV
ncbi:MAG TPA: 3-dehydroquinate synthase [Rhabdochlamydiaceae bacterium]|jgi:3-dehydroquinate synthase|nr:3-dehydroquinate synthase [Rhabdochlamydiaceae bacterium]